MFYSIVSKVFLLTCLYIACCVSVPHTKTTFRNVSKKNNETFLFAYFEKMLYLCSEFENIVIVHFGA